LSAVAGEVVRDGPDFGEFVGGGQELVERLLRPFEFMQGECAVNPAVNIVGRNGEGNDSNVDAGISFFVGGINVPAHFEHRGMTAKLRDDPF
jgi:hypothetical protein